MPARFAPLIVRAAQRWDVSAHLLAAQLYAESDFNPFARSPAGAEGIAQFMPGTATLVGLADPFDPEQAIDAQARLMRDLLRPLRLRAARAGRVQRRSRRRGRLRLHPAVRGDTRLRRQDPRPAGGAGAGDRAPLEVRLVG